GDGRADALEQRRAPGRAGTRSPTVTSAASAQRRHSWMDPAVRSNWPQGLPAARDQGMPPLGGGSPVRCPIGGALAAHGSHGGHNQVLWAAGGDSLPPLRGGAARETAPPGASALWQIARKGPGELRRVLYHAPKRSRDPPRREK